MSAQTDIEPVATTFRAIGTDHTILATDPDALEPAVRLAQQHLADLDLAASRFRSDSEVSGLARTPLPDVTPSSPAGGTSVSTATA